ncbi:MAG: DUF4337 domain-containing protein [Silvanigrellaceae bacterium]
MSGVDKTESTTDKNDSWEVYFGLALSVFAAILAINELGGSKFGDDEIQLGNEKTKAYMWYQSKSIKESLAKGQVELLDVLGQSGAIVAEKAAAMSTLKEQIKLDVARYKKEKDEILRGSKAVGPENHVQDVDGKMGVVVGAKEIEDQQAGLSAAGDNFDIATLFLQISLVLGAIGLITKTKNVRLYFFAGLVTLGIAGSVFCLLAFRSAFAATGG